MQLHAEGTDTKGSRRSFVVVGGDGRGAAATERDAAGDGRVDVGVLAPVTTLEVAVQTLEDGGEGRGLESAERRKGDVIVAAVVKNDQTQVVLEPLHDDEDAGVQIAGGREVMLTLGDAAQGLHDEGGEALAHEREQLGAALVAERNTHDVAAPAALGDEKPLFEIPASDEGFELTANEVRQRGVAGSDALEEGGQVLAHDGDGVALMGAAVVFGGLSPADEAARDCLRAVPPD